MSLKLKMYFASVYVILAVSFFLSIYFNFVPVDVENYVVILFFSLMTAITESFTITFFRVSFSTTFSITLATFILFGPLNTIIVIIIGFSIRILKNESGQYRYLFNTPFYGTAFNYCALALPILFANYVFVLLGGLIGVDRIRWNVSYIVLFSIIYCIINTFIVSALIAIKTNKNVIYCFFNNIKMALLNFLVMTPFGLVLSVVFSKYQYTGVLFLLIPIVLVRYTFFLYGDAKNQYIQTVDALMNSIEARDKYTEGHSQRVAEISLLIAKALKYNQWKLEQLNMAAMLHDVGKIGVSDTILNKPGKLSNEEFKAIKEHPAIGYKILKEVKNLEVISEIVKHHHERYDGKGYPDGKKGDEIPMDVYIIQLADSVDAMSTDRPYRRALSKDEIITEIEQNMGTQFHPQIAAVYLGILKQ